MPNPNPTALDYVYGRMSSGGCQHVAWVVTADDAALGLTVGQKLRESVVAGVGVFWRVIGEKNDLPSHPDVTKIDFPSSGGGGGGPVTVNTTDTEYLRWEVTAPDTTLGLAVGDYVIQSIINNVSTWRKFGSATALATAPDLTTLRPESDGGTMIEYRVKTAHGTAPSAFAKDEILWRFVSDDGSVIWRREGVKAPIATAPNLANLERVVAAGASAPGAVLEWRVITAHGTAPDNFAVDDILREFVGAGNVSTWYRRNSTTAIATAPIRANLEPAVAPATVANPTASATTKYTPAQLATVIMIAASITEKIRIIQNNTDKALLLNWGGTDPAITTAIYYRVITAHNGLLVDDEVKQSITLGVSTWTRRNGSALPGAAPSLLNLNQIGQPETVSSDYDYEIEPGGQRIFEKAAGHWLAEIRVLGANTTSGLVKVTRQS